MVPAGYFSDLFIFSICRGEHILLFLVQTVARQSVEHCQYRPPRIREDRNRKAANAEGILIPVNHHCKLMLYIFYNHSYEIISLLSLFQF